MKRLEPVILADGVSLATLAERNALDTLEGLETPVVIPDVVLEQARVEGSDLANRRLMDWIASGKAAITQTPLIKAWRELEAEQPETDGTPATFGMREAAFAWIVANVGRLTGGTRAAVLIAELGTPGPSWNGSFRIELAEQWIAGDASIEAGQRPANPK